MNTFQVGYAPELLQNVPYPLQHSCIIGNTADSTDYVYDIQDMGETLLAITTSANHNIHIYDKTQLIPTAQLVYHQNSIRCMQRVRSAGHLLLSCGDDGQVALWDLRQHSHTPSQIYSGKQYYQFILIHVYVYIYELNSIKVRVRWHYYR
jgi:WD40 repeat protein